MTEIECTRIECRFAEINKRSTYSVDSYNWVARQDNMFT